ncbi:MAG: hypothetical protein Q8Q11_00675 [bacterium]|nr:hypothetical protein [bacterium]MDZ4247677.1 hypothetical protein [Patescibacteria group bacterium]
MTVESPELQRARELSERLDAVEEYLRDNRVSWEDYMGDCLRDTIQYMSVSGNTQNPELKELFGELCEKHGSVMWGGSEAQLKNRLDIAGLLLKLSDKGVSFPDELNKKGEK